MRKYSYVTNKKIRKLQRTIDLLAYGSLTLDVCIAFITLLSLSKISAGEQILVPIQYLLTLVVVMSLAAGAMIFYLRYYESLVADFLRVRYKIKTRFPDLSRKKRFRKSWNLKSILKKFR